MKQNIQRLCCFWMRKLSALKQPADDPNSKHKLLTVNEVIANPVVVRWIGIGVFVLMFLGLNGVVQALASFPNAPGLSIFNLNFSKYGSLYFFFLIVSGICSLMIRYKIKVNIRDYNVGQKGDSRFMSMDEIAQTFLKIPDQEASFEGIGGLPVFRSGDQLYIDNRINNNFILALTRGGKGQMFVLPSIDILSRAGVQSSMIINDSKNGELSRASIHTLMARGYDIKILNFDDPEHSHGYNLLGHAMAYYRQGQVHFAQNLCNTMAYSLYASSAQTEKFWSEAPAALVSAVALAMVIDGVEQDQEHTVNMYSLAVFIGKMESKRVKKNTALDLFFDQRADLDPAKLAYMSIRFSVSETRASILSVAYARLKIFMQEGSAKILSKHEIDLEAVGFDAVRPTALFLRIPQNNPDYFAITSILFSQAYQVLMNQAITDQHQGKCLRPVKFIGDEIFNGPPMEHFDKVLSMCLSANISFDLYAQSYDQVKAVYGKHAGIILDGCSTKVYITSDSQETRKLFSSRLGNYTQKNVSRSGTRFSLSKNITESYEQKPLLSEAQLLELEEGEAVIFSATKRKDLALENITPRPIFARGQNRFLYQHEYLPSFSVDQKIPYEVLSFSSHDVQLEDMIYGAPQPKTDQHEATKNRLQNMLSKDVLQTIAQTIQQSSIEADIGGYTPNEFLSFLHDAVTSGVLKQPDAATIYQLFTETR